MAHSLPSIVVGDSSPSSCQITALRRALLAVGHGALPERAVPGRASGRIRMAAGPQSSRSRRHRGLAFSPANWSLSSRFSTRAASAALLGLLRRAQRRVRLVSPIDATNRVKTYSNPPGPVRRRGHEGVARRSPPAQLEPYGRRGLHAGCRAPRTAGSHLLRCARRTRRRRPATDADRLGLSVWRFRLSVSWKDSNGRTGVGQPVPLTNDTGYFWFFPRQHRLVIGPGRARRQ
jgi:hypothetical protein